MSSRLALHLLGPPKLEIDGSPITADRRKVIALLAYLALNRGRHTRDFLSALLWPEYDQAKAFTNLRHVLWETQQAIGDGWINADRETVGLNKEADIWLDVAHFKALIQESHTQTDIALRIPLLTDSVTIYRNHFLTGFSLKDAPHFNEWAFAKSEELRHQLASALTMLSDNLCSLGQAEAAILHAQRLVSLDPLNETSHRHLMQIYLQAGQHNAALKQYQTCENILRKEMGIDPQPETRELYKKIRKRELKSSRTEHQKETSPPPHNLPFQLSKFIGREKELREIDTLISGYRLVTLIGTGGIGKTRLSLKTGEQVLNRYPDGVWLVELASLRSDPALVPQTVAKLFNLMGESEDSIVEKLVHVVGSKHILLILDNCEHLLDASAHLADALLKNCPNLNILATSREAFGITGEARYNVPPLGLPDIKQLLEQILGYESIRLFEERARLVQDDFSLTTVNASTVAHICHRLDGIPLAIELAAARVNLLSPEQIALRLDESFNILAGGSRTAMPRQQTLRTSIDWSWNLLSEPEQTILRRLSIFAGGWTLDAAEEVCAGNGIESRQVLDVMTQLAAKSLVVVNQEAGREKRYRLLEMVREFAREKSMETGEENNIHARHLQYFLDLSARIEHELVGYDQMEWFARTTDERDNLRVALEFASTTDRIEAGLSIPARLLKFWEYYDINEGMRWLAEFLHKPESKEYPRAKAKVLYVYGWFLSLSNQVEAARSAAEECLAICRSTGDQHCEVDGLYLLGFISEGEKKTEYCLQALALARALGDIAREAAALNFLGWDHSNLKRALAYWEESIPLHRQMGNRRSLANCLSRIGYYLVLQGEIESGQEHLDEAVLLFQQLNITTGRDHINAAYAQIALMRGDYEKARAYYQENARLVKESGSHMEYLWENFHLGAVDMSEGNITEARRTFLETAQEFHRNGYTIGVVTVLQQLASLNIMVGKSKEGAQLIGWTDATRERIRNVRPVIEQADVDRDIAAIVTRVGRDVFELEYNRGTTMSVDEAVTFALDTG